VMMENATNNPAIRLRGLTKSFGEQKVLERVDLEVARGETMNVLGRSGTGKSVMLKLIIGLQKPDGGDIELNGEPITSLTLDDLNRVRKTVGFLFQGAALYDSMNVEENVAFPLRRHTKMEDDERQTRVRELLSRVGMEEAARKMPSDISGGMKKRVAIARALVIEPQLILYDEPTSELDPLSAVVIGEEIIHLKDRVGVTSLIVTHDRDLAFGVSDRIAVINEGRILTIGTPEEVKHKADPLIQKFLHANLRHL